MRAWGAFFKKELCRQLRGGQLWILLVVFTVLGVMNPAIAKLTPKMLALLADTLAESGMQVTHVEVNALTSWTQYFKNMPIGLVAFVLMQSNLFTAEYESGTLIPVLTKGLRRSHVVTAKAAVLLLFWSAGNVVSFGLTYLYTGWYWDNCEIVHLAAAAGGFFLYGLWLLSLLVLFSCLFRTSSLVLLSTGGCAAADRLLGLLPDAKPFLPGRLLDVAGLLTGTSDAGVLLDASVITAALCLVSVGAGICALNRKL